MRNTLLALAIRPCAVLLMAGLIGAAEIHVPADAATLQAAIDLAVDGDEIVVADGVYRGAGNRDLRLHGKAITLRSANGPAACEIDCESVARAFRFLDGEGRDTVIQGFTVRRARLASPVQGQALLLLGSSPTLRDCRFLNNGFYYVGSNFGPNGVLYVQDGSPHIVDCEFVGNRAGNGGAIYAVGGAPRIERCVFRGNRAESDPQVGIPVGYTEGTGGAIMFWNVDGGLISNCLFADNHAALGGGGLRLSGSTGGGLIADCTFRRNHNGLYGALAGFGLDVNLSSASPARWKVTRSILYDGSAEQAPLVGPDAPVLAVTHCDVRDGYPGEGNFDADPLFVEPFGADAHLRPDSPCIDVLPARAELARPLRDLDRGSRLLDGDLDGELRRDVGAYEFSNVRVQVDRGAQPGSFTLLVDGTDGLPYSVQLARDLLAGASFTPGLGFELVQLPSAPLPPLATGSVPDQLEFALPGSFAPGWTVWLRTVATLPDGSAGNFAVPVALP